MTRKKLLQQIAISVVAVATSFVFAMWSGFTVDRLICGETNGVNAAGSGAAIGMLVLFYIGVPTIVFCTITEASRALITVRLPIRIFWLVLPAVISAILMAYFSGRLC